MVREKVNEITIKKDDYDLVNGIINNFNQTFDIEIERINNEFNFPTCKMIFYRKIFNDEDDKRR